MSKKLISMLLLCGMLLGAAACSSDTGADDADTTAADAAADTTAADVEDPNSDDLGEYDFGGEEFHMYSRLTASINGAMNVESETGDTLNDSIYTRNRNVEDRFNVTITETTGNNTDAARTSVLGGDDTYDIITTRCVYAYNYAGEGLLIPVSEVPHIDLTKNYWSPFLTNEMTILGKNYFAAGDFMLSGYDFTHMLLFNKEIANDFALGNMYEKVTSGKWTIDTYYNDAKAVTADIDGDGEMTAKDRYGMLAIAKQITPNFWISSGLRSVEKDADDKPVFTMPSNEKFYDVFDELFRIHWDEAVWLQNSGISADVAPEHKTAFSNGLSLFIDSTFFHVTSFRAMEADFGILPYPKWDEAQDDYYSRIEGCDLFTTPITNKNLELTGVVLEALASESARVTIPAYYDVNLQGKITRDDDSIEMLNIIFENRVFDWGDTIWCDLIRDQLRFMMEQNDRDLASNLAAIEPKVEAKIEENLEIFSNLD